MLVLLVGFVDGFCAKSSLDAVAFGLIMNEIGAHEVGLAPVVACRGIAAADVP